MLIQPQQGQTSALVPELCPFPWDVQVPSPFLFKSTQLQVLVFAFLRNVKNCNQQEAMGSEPALQSTAGLSL